MKRGFSLIELLIALGVLSFLGAGIFLAYSSILDTIQNSEARNAGNAVLNEELEVIRNMSYEDIGTVGGVPAGLIPQAKTVAVAGYEFIVRATVRNIDDPFDGTIGGNPNDTAPADYKLVELLIECSSCGRFTPFVLAATVSPIGLENTSGNGSLFVNVFDSMGTAIPGVNVHVVNASTTPSINLTDTTNAQGVLQLVDVPTSSLSYQVDVSRAGYTSDRSYPLGAAGNPDPAIPHATVAAQTLTTLSFQIDRVSTLAVETRTATCAPLPGRTFTFTGSKLISRTGTLPEVPKVDTSFTTNASGTYSSSSIEWDTYALQLTGASDDVRGMTSLPPFIVSPSSTYALTYTLLPADPPSLLVAVRDVGTGAMIPDASVVATRSGFSETKITGREPLTHTDWSGGAYAEQSGGIEADAVPGELSLMQSGGTYATGTVRTLTSLTLDTGSVSSSYFTIRFSPTSQPPAAGAESVRFQLASNNDDATWNFSGPDGTPASYYITSGAPISATHANTRYIRYKLFMQTDDENTTPSISDVSLDFRGACVPLSQVLFTDLTLATYTLTANASGYHEATTTISVSGNWQQVEIPMTPL